MPRIGLVCFLIVVASVFQTSHCATEGFPTKTWRFKSCSFDNVDECARIVMLFGARELVLPDNEDDMKPHCAEEKSAVKCVSDWSKKCLKGFQRQLFQIMLGGGARNIKERCSKEGTKRYLKSSKCVITSFSQCHDCMDTVKMDVVAIRRNPEKKEWIATGCCLLDKFRTCFDEAIAPHCDTDGKSFLNWCVNSYINDIRDLACADSGGFEGEKCQKLIGKIKHKTDNVTEATPKSLFAPLYKMLLEFGDLGEEFAP